MNKIDLLSKLIALANNNPNEHEANLAARKVCRLLIELKVNFKSRSDQSKPATTWKDVQRSDSSFWKSSPQQPNSNPYTKASDQNPYTQPNYDPFEFLRNEFIKARDAERTKDYYKRPPTEYGIPKDYPIYNYDEPKKPKEKRPLKCTKCGNEKITGYIGNLYVCDTCQWNEYQENK